MYKVWHIAIVGLILSQGGAFARSFQIGQCVYSVLPLSFPLENLMNYLLTKGHQLEMSQTSSEAIGEQIQAVVAQSTVERFLEPNAELAVLQQLHPQATRVLLEAFADDRQRSLFLGHFYSKQMAYFVSQELKGRVASRWNDPFKREHIHQMLSPYGLPHWLGLALWSVDLPRDWNLPRLFRPGKFT